MGFYQKMAAEREAKKLGVYKVLESDMVKGTDRERASTIASLVATGDEAFKLAGHDNFSYFELDRDRRCGVVRYRGMEVLLLFKRKVLEREPGPGDPIPEKTLTEPKEAWIQIDLLNLKETTTDRSVVRKLQDQVQNLQTLWKAEEAHRKLLEEQITNWKEEKIELKSLREKVALQTQEKKLLALEIEGLKSEVKQEKFLRKDDKVSIIRELFPVFNTTWLAGLYRVEDALYSIIRKQLVEALGKIGVKLIEPRIGVEFNPAIHNALHANQFEKGAKEIGAVVNVHRVGMMLSEGRVIEAAEVSVGVEKPEEEKSGNETVIDLPSEDSIAASGGDSSGDVPDVGQVAVQDTAPIDSGREGGGEGGVVQ